MIHICSFKICISNLLVSLFSDTWVLSLKIRIIADLKVLSGLHRRYNYLFEHSINWLLYIILFIHLKNYWYRFLIIIYEYWYARQVPEVRKKDFCQVFLYRNDRYDGFIKTSFKQLRLNINLSCFSLIFFILFNIINMLSFKIREWFERNFWIKIRCIRLFLYQTDSYKSKRKYKIVLLKD